MNRYTVIFVMYDVVNHNHAAAKILTETCVTVFSENIHFQGDTALHTIHL